MSEDDALEGDEEPRSPSKPPPAGPKPGAPHMALRVVLGFAGLLLVVGFFLPWVQIDREMRSGLELVVETDPDVREMVDETQRWILLVIPLLGAALTAVGFLGVRGSGAVATVIGFLLMAYGMITVVLLFFQRTGMGLWIIVGATILALGVGLFALLRARQSKQAPPKEITLEGTRA